MEEENLVSVEKAKSCFGRLGWALCAYAMVIVVLQLVAVAIGGVLFAMGVNVLENAWFLWAASFIPQYLVGVPLFLLILRKMPVVEQSQTKLGGGKFWALLLVSFPVMSLGNIIGTFLSGLLSGGTAQNGVEAMVSGGNPLILFTVVILAPLVEELVFRKQLLDRCAQYGEKTAMVFSALTFALFHMNLFQFFYAFGMGLIFAYVYLRTRRLRYPVLMHMIINFMGSVVPPESGPGDAGGHSARPAHLPGLCGSAAGAGHCGPGDWHCYAKVLHPSARPGGAAPGGSGQDGIRQCGLYSVCRGLCCGL